MRQTETRQCDDVVQCPGCGAPYDRERGWTGIRLCPRCKGAVDADPIVEEGPLEGPFYSLCAAVRRAVADYDQTRDHSRHGPGSDCVRCALVEALPPGARGGLEPRWSRVVAEVY